MRILPAVAIVLAMSQLAACTRKQPDVTATSPVAAPPAQAAPPATVAPPPPVATAAPANPSAPGVPEPSVAELNRALELWIFQRSGPPKDLNELVTAGYLKRLPTPPAGKKFIYDSGSMSVKAVEK